MRIHKKEIHAYWNGNLENTATSLLALRGLHLALAMMHSSNQPQCSATRETRRVLRSQTAL